MEPRRQPGSLNQLGHYPEAWCDPGFSVRTPWSQHSGPDVQKHDHCDFGETLPWAIHWGSAELRHAYCSHPSGFVELRHTNCSHPPGLCGAQAHLLFTPINALWGWGTPTVHTHQGSEGLRHTYCSHPSGLYGAQVHQLFTPLRALWRSGTPTVHTPQGSTEVSSGTQFSRKPLTCLERTVSQIWWL